MAAAGEAGAADSGVVVAVLAGGDATVPVDAGLSPRLLGLLIILAAMLLTIFDSFIEVSSRAPFKMSERCLVSA